MTPSSPGPWKEVLDDPDAESISTTKHDPERSERDSIATQLVRLARAQYQFFRSDDGRPFVVPVKGPRIVRMIRDGPVSLRTELASMFVDVADRVAPSGALNDALAALEGFAQREPPTRLWRRIAPCENGVLIDLGDESGKSVRVDSSGWTVVDSPDVYFARSNLTGPLPQPERGGSIDGLITLLNVGHESRELLVGYLVAALLPTIAHPIALLVGEQGTGKSTAAEIIASLIDPGPAPLRTSPSDLEAWCSIAGGSWVIALDNLSGIPGWLSDALCRSSSGDAIVKRRLYTDSDVSVVAFRRVVLLTAIDHGALRGDLGDRLVRFELLPISTRHRLGEVILKAKFASLRPWILGALLDMLAGVLGELPFVELADVPRMADFARVLAAMDRAIGSNALAAYLGQRREICDDVVEGDPFAVAIQVLAEAGPWRGTSAQLLEVLPRPPGARNWPHTPESVAAKLRLLGPALRAAGVVIERLPRTKRERPLEIRLMHPLAQTAVTTVTPTILPVAGGVVPRDHESSMAKFSTVGALTTTTPSDAVLGSMDDRDDSGDRPTSIPTQQADAPPRAHIPTVDVARSTGDPSSQFGAVTDPPGAASTPAPEP